MTSFLILIGAMLVSAGVGYVIGQMRTAPQINDQAAIFSAELQRLRRRATQAERKAEQKMVHAERIRRRERLRR